MSKIVQPGIYQHYKGPQYEVLCVAKNSKTVEDMVVYRALYGDFQLWVRSLHEFLEEVEQDGIKQPRFKWLKPGDR